MNMQTHNAHHLSICSAVSRWMEKPPQSPELVIAYGGMRCDEIELILKNSFDGSLLFWVEHRCPTLSPALECAVAKNLLRVSGVSSDMPSVFFDFFDPKKDFSFVLLNGERASEKDITLCSAALRSLKERISLDVFNTGTLVSKGLLWQHNTLENLPRILQSPGIGVLGHQFDGKPAVVAGAGPSLTSAIPYLKMIRNKVVLISTGTALAPLRNAGMRPDLVIAVDGSHLIAHQFETKTDDLYFIGSTVVYPKITGKFKGTFFSFLEANPIDQWVKKISAADGRLYAGGTVTACGMDVALEMGCDPVITVGLDLAFGDDGGSHADGTMYHGLKFPKEKLLAVPGNWDKEVYTTGQFNCYIELVSQYVIYNKSVRFINITDGGALIRGMTVQHSDYLSELDGDSFDAYEHIEHVHAKGRPEHLEKALVALRDIADYLGDVQTATREGAMASNRLLMMRRHAHYSDKEEMQACIKKVNQVDAVLDQSGEYDFLKMSLWGAAYELAINTQQCEERMGREEIMISRARRFYEQIAGASKWSRALIWKACYELERIVKLGDPKANALKEVSYV